MGKTPDTQLSEGLALRVPRAEAVRLLREVIGRGETLARRRAPVDLRVKTSQARELVDLLRTWGTNSLDVVNACFGKTAADVVRKVSMRYTTLEAAKGAVEGRLTLLTEALTLARRLRKAPEKRQNAARTPKSRTTTASSHQRTSPPGSQAVPGRRFDFCLSFAGENRSYAKRLNTLLGRRGARVFYDDDRKHELVGEDLARYLDQIYQYDAHFCVIFVSQHYPDKDWTRYELRAALARALKQHNYILPVLIDDTPVPGLQITTGRLDVREEPLARIADVLMGRLASAQTGNGVVVTPPEKRTRRTKKSGRPPARKRPSRSLVLLGDHFYEEVYFREVDDVITVHLRPRNGEEMARLRTLKASGGQGAFGWGNLPFAYDLDGARVHVQNVEYEGEGGLRKTIVTLRTERPVRQGFSFGQDARGLAERSARFVLFGEALRNEERGGMPVFDRATDARLSAGLIRSLWQHWKGTKADFLAAARLLLVFELKSLGIVDHVTALGVGPWKGARLPISLQGYRQEPYREGRIEVAVQGEVELG